MKKTISIILALSILFCLPCFAFAEETALTLNTHETIHFDEKEEKVFNFTPSEDGVYCIGTEFKDTDDKHIYLIYSNVYAEGQASNDISSFLADYHESLFSSEMFYFPAEKGKRYTIDLSNATRSYTDTYEDGVFVSVDIDLVIQKYDARTLEMNKTYTVSKDTCYFFAAPQQDEIYYIPDCEDILYINVASADGYSEFLDYNNLTANEFVFKLEKGKKYMITVSGGFMFFGKPDDFSFSFSTKDGSKVLPKEISVDSGYIIVGEAEELYYDISPVGSEINSSGVTVTVDNEKTAEVYWSDEYQCYMIKGLRPGIVTVTVTDNSSGVSGKGVLTVANQIQSIFSVLPDSFYNFFLRLLAKFYEIIDKLSIF